MNRTTTHAAVAVALLFSAGAIAVGMSGPGVTMMSRDDYAAGRRAIDDETMLALARCRALEGKENDVCKAEAHADERVRIADLDAQYRGTVAAATDARVARVKAQFDVAKVKCGDLDDDDGRYECVNAARAQKTRAIALVEAGPN